MIGSLGLTFLYTERKYLIYIRKNAVQHLSGRLWKYHCVSSMWHFYTYDLFTKFNPQENTIIQSIKNLVNCLMRINDFSIISDDKLQLTKLYGKSKNKILI